MIVTKRKYTRKRMHVRDQERFWKLVEKGEPEECWNWKGPTYQSNSKGRARKGDPICFIKGTGRSINPQVIAYEAAGNIRKHGFRVQNTCDNKFCCNPGHLRYIPGQEDDEQE